MRTKRTAQEPPASPRIDTSTAAPYAQKRSTTSAATARRVHAELAFWRRAGQTAVLPCAACILLAILVAVTQIARTGASSVDTTPREGYLLIDPGHGGADGGATAADGMQEKNINLAISLPLASMLRLWGYDVVLTRQEDISIHSSGAVTIREQKVSDMKNRLALYEKASLVLSIHQNQFSASQYFGTQIFYSPNHPASKVLAASVRESVLSQLQPQNKRALKKGTKDIYLLSNTQVPAILIECGFLSNPEECRKLEQTAYQKQMAFSILTGTLTYHAT